MRPVLECAAEKEVSVREAADLLATQFSLSDEERAQILPSGNGTTFYNRVHWAKTYLKQAGLVTITKRGYFKTTEEGLRAIQDKGTIINNEFLNKFASFQSFRSKKNTSENNAESFYGVREEIASLFGDDKTPDEDLREIYEQINSALAKELLDRVRAQSPAFFENTIIALLLAMGYGGASQTAGRSIGRSGDDGVDGVIDQDPLGVDQIYIQAKRYSEGNNISAAHIRDFFGALSIQKAGKGIFVTTSAFTDQAIRTARDLGNKIVLIDGNKFANLMIQYGVGCRTEDTLIIRKIDEDFFDI